ncbi:TonB-dependent siderophore receptor [Aliirhizobium smilacinae]|nr:TonB-dependent siderophore receptor [Rhizobium smilacinae]
MVSGKTRRTRFGACIVVSSLVGAAGSSTSVNAQESTELAPIVLEGSGASQGDGQGGGLKTKGYVAKETSVATKSDTDIRKVPQSIGTISRKELEDRNVQSLVEAARYTAGVRAGQFGFDPRFDTIFIRGFNVTDTGFYRDGLRSLGGPFSVFRHEPYTLQGVTILKGPSSGVYGSGAPGGIVNVISKRPTEEPFREIEGQIGSYDRAQVNFDLSGPVADNDNVLYRLTGVKRAADTQFMAARDDRFSIAPALTLRSDDQDTQLTILGEYTDFTSGGAAGWFTSPSGTITDLEQGDPRYRDYDGRQYRFGYEFEHRLTDEVVFKQNVRYQNIDTDMKYVGIALVLGDFVLRAPERLRDEASGIAVDNQLLWSFDTGPLEHKLMTGVDYSYVDYRWRYGRGGFMFNDQAPIIPPTALDLFDERTNQQQVGLYIQDQIDYDRWSLTVGGRFDWLETSKSDLLENSSGNTEKRDHKFTGRIGLAYLFDNGLSPYASYSTSFAPTTGASRTAHFKPTEGEQMEVGLRYTPEGSNLSISAALFDITQSSMLVNVSSTEQAQTGEVGSRGFEIQATSSITDALSLTAAYTYLDMKYQGDSEGTTGATPKGNFPAGIPDQMFSLWGQYNVLSGPLEGLGVGLGARFLDTSYADDKNTRNNPSRTLVDASMSYDFGKLRPNLGGLTAQVSAKNVFDDREVTCVNLNCYREQGRSVIGSLKFRF